MKKLILISVSILFALSVQYRSGSADFDLESTNGGVFDNTVPFTVWVREGIVKQ